MSFADRIGVSAPVEKPSCWGNKNAFDPEDSDCSECRFQNSCRQEVGAKQRVYQVGVNQAPRPSIPQTSYRPNYQAHPNDTYPTWAPGPTHENDRPLARLAKDVAVGGLHGLGLQFVRFFSVWRMK